MWPIFNIDSLFLPPFPAGPRLKELRNFELPTTAVALSETSVDFGINPCLYNELPCECFVTLKVRQSVPAGGEALPVTIVTPSQGGSTVSGQNSSSGQKTNVVDHNGDNVVGSDLGDLTEVYAYVNKELGVIRFVNFVSGGTQASAQAVNAVKSK